MWQNQDLGLDPGLNSPELTFLDVTLVITVSIEDIFLFFFN